MWFLVVPCRDPGRYVPWSADGWLVAGGAIERLFSACWTRERVEPVSFLGRCSDLLSLLGIHLYVIEHGVNSPVVSNAPVAAGPSKGAKAPWFEPPKVTLPLHVRRRPRALGYHSGLLIEPEARRG